MEGGYSLVDLLLNPSRRLYRHDRERVSQTEALDGRHLLERLQSLSLGYFLTRPQTSAIVAEEGRGVALVFWGFA